MKILYVNFIDNLWGHKRLDTNLIEYLSTFADVTVISPVGWYENLSDRIKVINYQPSSRALNNPHYLSLKIMNFSAKIDKKERFDYIFAASFDTYSFAVGRMFFKKQSRMYLLHHNNTDMLNRNKMKYFFNTYVNKVKHIVFEEFIAEYLVSNFGLSPDNVVVLPHPLSENTSINESGKFDCVGISNSNDENFINAIIEKERELEILKDKRISVILRSKLESQTYSDGYLNVITGYLDAEKYNFYINSASSLFLPFPTSFNFRMSGSLMDALSNKKIVIGTDIPLLREYSKKYPHICFIVKNINEFFEIVEKIYSSYENISNKIQNEFMQFANEHSRQKIIGILKDEFTNR